MSMNTLDEMWDIVSEHIEEITDDMKKKGVTRDNLMLADTATHTLKNICAVDSDDGYSQAGDWEARGRFGDQYARDGGEGGNSYGNSYAGRRRDDMGRFSRNDGMSYRGGRRGGYSRSDGLMEHVDMMMEEATDGNQREAIRRFKKELEGMM